MDISCPHSAKIIVLKLDEDLVELTDLLGETVGLNGNAVVCDRGFDARAFRESSRELKIEIGIQYRVLPISKREASADRSASVQAVEWTLSGNFFQRTAFGVFEYRYSKV